MNTSYTINPLDHTHASVNMGEVLLSFAHKCGCKVQYLFSSEHVAKEILVQYQKLECRSCADNTAYGKKTSGYLGMIK